MIEITSELDQFNSGLTLMLDLLKREIPSGIQSTISGSKARNSFVEVAARNGRKEKGILSTSWLFDLSKLPLSLELEKIHLAWSKNSMA